MIQFGDLDTSLLFEFLGSFVTWLLEPDPVQIAFWVMGVFAGVRFIVSIIRRRRW